MLDPLASCARMCACTYVYVVRELNKRKYYESCKEADIKREVKQEDPCLWGPVCKVYVGSAS